MRNTFISFLYHVLIYAVELEQKLLVLLLFARIDLYDRRQRCEDAGPDQLKLVLTPVQAMTEPHSPNNVEVCSGSSHEMPPSMSLKEDTPRQANLVAPLAQTGAVDIVQSPNAKAAQKDGQSHGNHEPHGLEDLAVSVVLALLFLLAEKTLLAHALACCLSGLRVRADVALHDVHRSEQDNCCQECVHVLVEDGITKVVVIACNKD